jgi:O-antigen ligase
MTSDEHAIASKDQRDRAVFFMLAGLLVATFLLGGTSRADAASLVVLRPLSAACLVAALFSALGVVWKRQWQIVLFAASFVLLVVLHLVPLPPFIWMSLPGREVISNVFAVTGRPAPWLPLSMSPLAAWNALFALMGPVAALLFALALPGNRLPALLKIVLVVGIVSALLGLLQSIGPMHGPLYFYRLTNYGTAVGLFANRNHQAIFLATLFPMIAAFAALAEGRKDRVRFYRITAIATGAFLIPLLLVTGSRAGLLLGTAGILSCLWIYRPALPGNDAPAQAVGSRRILFGSLVGGVAVLGLMTAIATRASAFQRLVELDAAQDLRFRAFPVIWKAAWTYFPFGSGIGSFVDVYKIVEPQVLLSPNYLNRAHNDVLEAMMTGGLPAILLMVIAAVLLSLAGWRLAHTKLAKGRSRRDGRERAIILGRAGVAALLILAIGSIADYPLRVPSLSLIFMVYAAFVLSGWQAATTPSGER